MEYLYAALLLHHAGREINEQNIRRILDAVAIKTDEAKIKALVSALEGVNIDEVLKQAAMPVAMPVTAEPKPEEKKEEKKKEEEAEKKAEEAAAGLSSLFG
jgi:large subunit ribosomal protein L12